MPLLSSFIDALFGTRCVLCRRLGPTCCNQCWVDLSFDPRRVARPAPDGSTLQGVAAIDFGPRVGALVHAFKESGLSVLAERFASAMAPLMFDFCAEMGISGQGTCFLVPVPSRVSSIQTRGFSPAAEIAGALTNLLEPRWGRRKFETPVRFAIARQWVWRAKESADQAGLDLRDRKQNLVDTMSASSSASNKRIILVDDIVTTGASLFETARALRSVGAEIVGFITFAETILKKMPKTPTR